MFKCDSSRILRSCSLLLLLQGSPWARAGADAGLPEAASSPLALQRFIEENGIFKLSELWEGLGVVHAGPSPSCEQVWARRTCSSELIRFLAPPLMIVLVHNYDANSDIYLRYMPVRSDAEDAWKFAGYFETSSKYFPLRHTVVSAGKTQFLVVNGQDASGTGAASEVEHWLDLSAAEFRPAFSYVLHGHFLALADGYVSREFRGSILTIKDEPTETITLSYRIDFTYDRLPMPVRLGSRTDTVAFSRGPDGLFAPSQALSTLRLEDLDLIYGAAGDAFSCDQLVRFDRPELSLLANRAGPGRGGDRVRQFVDNWCSEGSKKLLF
jgi:hypothetical protein